MRNRPESSIVLLLMMLAIILAIGAFLGVSILLERPADAEQVAATAVAQATPLPNTVLVEGETITLLVDPNMRPMVVPPEVVQPPAVVTQAPEAAPTAVPTIDQTVIIQPTTQPVPVPAAGGQPADHVIFIQYQVQPGDTLYRIQENQITSIALMAKHNIAAHDVVAGNILNLPVGNSAACGGWRAYVVLRGDTAFSLSKRANISLEELRARNNLDANYSLYETQVICLP